MSQHTADEKQLLELACTNHGCRVLALAGVTPNAVEIVSPCRCFDINGTSFAGSHRLLTIIELATRIRNAKAERLEAANLHLRRQVVLAKQHCTDTEKCACLWKQALNQQIAAETPEAGK